MQDEQRELAGNKVNHQKAMREPAVALAIAFLLLLMPLLLLLLILKR
jgi:hypothetical protein